MDMSHELVHLYVDLDIARELRSVVRSAGYYGFLNISGRHSETICIVAKVRYSEL